jgi:hypothetical protein
MMQDKRTDESELLRNMMMNDFVPIYGVGVFGAGERIADGVGEGR